MVLDKVHVVAGVRVHGAGHLAELPIVVVDQVDRCRRADVVTLLHLQLTVAPECNVVEENNKKVDKVQVMQKASPVPRSPRNSYWNSSSRTAATVGSCHAAVEVIQVIPFSKN